MKTIQSITFALTILLLSSCAKVYYSPDAYTLAKRHKIIAIIPPKVVIKPKKDSNIAALKEEEKIESVIFQKEMYLWLLKRKTEKKFKPKLLDLETTNAELAKVNFPETDMSNEDLCKLLQVDAVIRADYNLSHPMSEGAALALGYLRRHHIGWIAGNINEVYATLKIYDAKEQKEIWNYQHKSAGSFGSTPERLVDKLMRDASKKMPYGKKKKKITS